MRRNQPNGTAGIASYYVHGALTALIACVGGAKLLPRFVDCSSSSSSSIVRRRQTLQPPTQLAASSIMPVYGRLSAAAAGDYDTPTDRLTTSALRYGS